MGNKTYRFRLYPNQEQQQFLAKCFGCSRFVYNHFLRLTTDVYADCKNPQTEVVGYFTSLAWYHLE